MAHRQMQLSILTQTLIFMALFGVLSSIQQVFDMTYGRGEGFPLWFALIALLAAPSGPDQRCARHAARHAPDDPRRALALAAAALGTGAYLLQRARARGSWSISSGP
jgi:uncharacterized membrane protein YbhN (UPF0104 family)